MERVWKKLLAIVAVAGMAGTAGVGIAADASRWSYSGATGPAKWAKLEKDFVACAQGKTQSPIDIPDAEARKGDLPPLLFDYRPSPLRIIDNGHTIQVNYAPGSSIELDGTQYELVQFHFHKPSEEKIDGKSHAMVAHFVHKSPEGKLAVVAVLLDKGGANGLIDSIWKNLPTAKEKEVLVTNVTIDAANLLPESKGYYTFQGSLTTPPCSEEVTWLVLKTPVKIGDGEITAFGKIYPMNARPTQALNGRAVQATR